MVAVAFEAGEGCGEWVVDGWAVSGFEGVDDRVFGESEGGAEELVAVLLGGGDAEESFDGGAGVSVFGSLVVSKGREVKDLF